MKFRIILVLICILIISCKEDERHNHSEKSIDIPNTNKSKDSIKYYYELMRKDTPGYHYEAIVDTPKASIPAESSDSEQPKKYLVWSSKNLNLPKGVVTHGESIGSDNSSNNYLIIKKSNGVRLVIKNVPWQVYSAVERYDTIR